MAREGSNGSSELNPSARDSSVGALAKERAEAKTKLDAISPRVDEPAPPDDKKLSDVQPSGGLQSPSSLPAVPSPQPPKTAQASPQLQANAAPNAPAAPAPELDSGANAIGAAGSREKQAVMAQSDAAQQSGAGPAKKQSAAESRLNEQKAQAFTLARPIQKDAAFLKAPSGTTLWRAGSSGSIERSLDGGTTWTQQASPTKDDWLAGAAVSDTACWLVGRHGAIARTVDGEHWELIAPPAQAASPNSAPPDWTAVTAIDSQTATITAGDGRKFSTVDGGKAWRPR